MFGFHGRRRERRENKRYYTMLREVFGLKPNNVELYKLALIHRSASHHLPDGMAINNERLEFLGDAIIESVVSDYLYIEFPCESEGFLTKMRSRMVNRVTLNQLCVDIGLATYIYSNSGGGHGGDGTVKNINGDAFEAIIGAMYLDKGYDFTNRLLIKLLSGQRSLDEVTSTETDFKSRLIEWCQKNRHRVHFTTSLGQWGDMKGQTFRSVAMIDGLEAGYGLGNSKKEAEQRAAYAVSMTLDDERRDALLDIVDNAAGENVPQEVPDESAPKRKKRHRGGKRHHKTPKPETVEPQSAEAEEVAPVVEEKPVVEEVKPKPVRKPRAPKVVKPEAETPVEVPAETPAKAPKEVKKPRSTPKPKKVQEAAPETVAEAAPEAVAPRRGRGRPRKVTQTEE